MRGFISGTRQRERPDLLARKAGRACLATLVFVAGCATAVRREGPPPPESLVAMANRLASGLGQAGTVGGAAVVVQGEESAMAFHGIADRETGEPVGRSTRFRAGSITKLFTAMEAARLADEGLLDLDAPLDTYLPGAAQLRAEGAGVPTIRDALTHRAGLPWNHLAGAVGPWERRKALRDGLDRLPEAVAAQPLPFPPGLGYAYSNVGYALVGLVLERVTGRKYETLIRDHWLTPLAMHDSGFGSARLAQGYEQGRPLPDEAIRDVPAGGLVSTAEDLGRFVRAILRGGRDHQGRVLLAPTTLRRCLLPQGTPGPLDLDFAIGLGWQLRGIEAETPLWLARHSGVIGPFRTELALAVDRGTGVVLLSNTAESEMGLLPLARQALDGLEPAKAPRPFTAEQTTGLAVPPPPRPKTPLPPNAVLEGRYAMPGATFALRADKDSLAFKWAGQDLRIVDDGSSRFKLEALLLGFLPVSPGRLAGMLAIPSVEEDGVWLMLRRPGGFWTFARKVEPRPLPAPWQSACGLWQPTGPEAHAVTSVTLRLEDGHLIADTRYRSGSVESRHLTPLGDDRALLSGFGRGLGEEWRLAADESAGTLIRYSGLTFRRADPEQAPESTPSPRDVPTAGPSGVPTAEDDPKGDMTPMPSGAETDPGLVQPVEGLDEGGLGGNEADAEEAFPTSPEP
ncbi:MAG: serine hydrolase domain-containing protein [Candidatus Sericytochromatia bacterium]|nr:serine hydrolase domain-containing protein [Candidatus Sericytochromatia bacterium]